jgi:hypothetical protein
MSDSESEKTTDPVIILHVERFVKGARVQRYRQVSLDVWTRAKGDMSVARLVTCEIDTMLHEVDSGYTG